jgi:hypothetical protein
MWLEDHFGSGSTLQRNEQVKLAASFWNNVGAGMVIAGMAAAFFLDKPPSAWTKIDIAIAGLVLGWLCYAIASTRRAASLSLTPSPQPLSPSTKDFGLHGPWD